MMPAKTYMPQWVRWITYLWLLVVALSLRAQSTSFSFTLDEPATTSAGVYAADGSLVRTLWSKVRYYSPGTFTAAWDGLDDSGKPVVAGNYAFHLLQHNTRYVWDGTIGNTSAELSGPTVHMAFYPICDIAIAGTNAFYVSGYNEGKYDFCKFATTDPQRVTAKWGPDGDTANIYDPSWNWTVTDGNWVYFGCPLTYAPNNLAGRSPGCIVAYKVADTSMVHFSNGTMITNGSNTQFPGLYVGKQPGISGLAVQQAGNLLAVAVAPDNCVYLLQKQSGAIVTNINVASPGGVSFSPDGSIWIISGNSVICYSNLDSSPTAGARVSGFNEALAVAVDPANPDLIVVADGGSSQQLKAYDRAANALWTYGLPGGYATNGVSVATNKFWFYNGQNDGTFISFAPDGSFWVGDGANDRCLHFSASLNYLEQIMYQPHLYVACADQNNPSRVFDGFLEFSVDHTKPLPQAWTLVNNWKANVDHCHISWNEGLRQVTTLTNGRTYALVDNNCVNVLPKQEVCELGPSQLRFTGVFPFGVNESSWITIGPDGSARFTTVGAANWYQSALTGFDAVGNPMWNPPTLLASASSGATDPVPRPGSGMNNISSISANNVLISFDQSLNNGWHLGGVKVGGTNWLWKASPAGDLNGRGTYEIDQGVQYGGNTASAIDHQVVYGYNGEFFRGQGQAAQTMHFYDDGLFVGQFGESTLGHQAYEGALPGYAGNDFSPSFVSTTNADYYLWLNDESAHGLQRWHLANARNIREQMGGGPMGTTITLTNQIYNFPSGVIGKPGNQVAEISWLPVPGATVYNVWYSFINGGPYTLFAGTTTNLDFVATGLTNGQTYYFAVTAVAGGVEGMPSEQAAVTPFDTSQPVVCAGSMSEGGQQTPVVQVSSTARASGQPSYLGAEHFTGVLSLRELDDYGYGNLQNETVGTKGYVIYDWSGFGANLVNLDPNFTITPGSGWSGVDYLERRYRVDGALGQNYGSAANPIASIAITVNDTNFHYLTVISPARFNNPRHFTMRLTSTNNTSAVFIVNEYPGYSHVFQYLFRGNVTLWADATGGAEANVQALFLDDAPVAGGTVTIPVTNLTYASSTTIDSSENPALEGDAVTFTASVSGSNSTPSGNVTFLDGSVSMGTATLAGDGLAAFTANGLSASNSPHLITAVYGGDSSYTSSTSATLSQNVTNRTSVTLPPNYVDVTNGLVSRYPLVTDGNDVWASNNLTLVNSPSFVSGAVNWNGSAPTLGYSPSKRWPQSGLTVTAWIKMADPAGNYNVAACYENTNGVVNQSYFQFFTMNKGLTARVVQNRDVNFIGRTTSASLTTGWHFVAFTWSGGKTSSAISVYLDGARIDNADQTYGTFSAAYAGSDIPLTVGAQVSPGGSFAGQFYGNQKDVRMYNRELSALEVGAIYTNGANPVAVTNAVPLAPPTNLHFTPP